MKYLLDTHVLIWLLTEDNKVPKNVKATIASPNNECLISIVSLWEISIKFSIGRLEIPMNLEELDRIVLNSGYDYLCIKQSHIFQSAKLPFHHQDPFDRLIIGQAIVENIPLISKDSQFSKYDVLLHPWN